MNESTPLVPRARVGADDVENPARGPEPDELRAVERDARETRNRVRHPVLIAIAWTMLFVVMATYFHSDGFEKVRAPSPRLPIPLSRADLACMRIETEQIGRASCRERV